MKELIENVIDWADKRNLLYRVNAPKQYLKFLEEVGETARAILKEDEAGIIDGFGDIAVTIIILSKQLDVDININFAKLDLTPSFSWFIEAVYEDRVSDNALDYLNDVSTYYGHSLEKCLNAAWNEIKDREGKTINGVYIKNN
jgi:hypothetical protein